MKWKREEADTTAPPAPKEVVIEAHGKGGLTIDGLEVQFTRHAWERIFAFIDAFPVEIQGFGRVRVVSPGVLRVTEVFLVDQDTVSAAHAVATEGFAAFCAEEMAADRPLEDIRFWWHSHGHLDTTWSSTDTTTMERFMDSGWLLALVGNKRGEFRIRFQSYDPRYAIDNLAAHIVLPAEDVGADDQVVVGKRIGVYRSHLLDGSHLDGLADEITARIRRTIFPKYKRKKKHEKYGGIVVTTAGNESPAETGGAGFAVDDDHSGGVADGGRVESGPNATDDDYDWMGGSSSSRASPSDGGVSFGGGRKWHER